MRTVAPPHTRPAHAPVPGLGPPPGWVMPRQDEPAVDLVLMSSTTAVIVLTGDQDLALRDDLERAVDAALLGPGRRRVIVDLSKTEMLSSVTLRALHECHTRARRTGGGMWLYAPSPAVMRVLRLVNLDRAFQVAPPGEVRALTAA